MANSRLASRSGRLLGKEPLFRVGVMSGAGAVGVGLVLGVEVGAEGWGLDDGSGVVGAIMLVVIGVLGITGPRSSVPSLPLSVRRLNEGSQDEVVSLARRLGFDWDGPDVTTATGTIHLRAIVDGHTVGYLMAQPAFDGLGHSDGYRITWLLIDPALPFDEVADRMLDLLCGHVDRRKCVATLAWDDVVRRRLLARHGFGDQRPSRPSSLVATYPGAGTDDRVGVIEVVRQL